jgi:hypothetical protein
MTRSPLAVTTWADRVGNSVSVFAIRLSFVI